jgi:hypothetical protein
MTVSSENPMIKIGNSFKFAVKQMNLRKRKEIQNLRPAFTSQIPSTLSIEIDLREFGTRTDSSFFADSIIDILCFVLSRIYKKYPMVNATFLDEKSFVEFEEIGIGIAMDDSDNLKVLSIQKSDLLSLAQIQEAIIGLLELYSSGETIPLATFNSTITITDLSQTQISGCVPTLSMGQASILAITRRKNGLFTLTCTYDHQVLAGKYVSEFLTEMRSGILSIFGSISGSRNSLECSGCAKTIEEELELSLINRGFIVLRKSIDEEILLCRVCFEGY